MALDYVFEKHESMTINGYDKVTDEWHGQRHFKENILNVPIGGTTGKTRNWLSHQNYGFILVWIKRSVCTIILYKKYSSNKTHSHWNLNKFAYNLLFLNLEYQLLGKCLSKYSPEN